MSRQLPAHKRYARPTTNQLTHQARAHRARVHKPLQLATPPITPERSLSPGSSNAFSVGSVQLSMPRTLPRPAVRPVTSAALAAIDPELANVPVEFVRQSVLGMSASICAASGALIPKVIPKSPLPRTMECYTPPNSYEQSHLPTHFLIVYDPRAGSQAGILYPAHSLVLATQCSNLPHFGPTTRELDENNHAQVPLVGFPVPAPHAFKVLNMYLYSHNARQLLAGLLPLPGAALASVSHESAGIESRLSRTMADWLSLRALLGALKIVHGVWANAASLGVNDDRLWTIIRFAWTVLIGAVERSAGVAPPNVYTDDEEADAVDEALGDAPPPYEA